MAYSRLAGGHGQSCGGEPHSDRGGEREWMLVTLPTCDGDRGPQRRHADEHAGEQATLGRASHRHQQTAQQHHQHQVEGDRDDQPERLWQEAEEHRDAEHHHDPEIRQPYPATDPVARSPHRLRGTRTGYWNDRAIASRRRSGSCASRRRMRPSCSQSSTSRARRTSSVRIWPAASTKTKPCGRPERYTPGSAPTWTLRAVVPGPSAFWMNWRVREPRNSVTSAPTPG